MSSPSSSFFSNFFPSGGSSNYSLFGGPKNSSTSDIEEHAVTVRRLSIGSPKPRIPTVTPIGPSRKHNRAEAGANSMSNFLRFLEPASASSANDLAASGEACQEGGSFLSSLFPNLRNRAARRRISASYDLEASSLPGPEILRAPVDCSSFLQQPMHFPATPVPVLRSTVPTSPNSASSGGRFVNSLPSPVASSASALSSSPLGTVNPFSSMMVDSQTESQFPLSPCRHPFPPRPPSPLHLLTASASAISSFPPYPASAPVLPPPLPSAGQMLALPPQSQPLPLNFRRGRFIHPISVPSLASESSDPSSASLFAGSLSAGSSASSLPPPVLWQMMQQQLQQQIQHSPFPLPLLPSAPTFTPSTSEPKDREKDFSLASPQPLPQFQPTVPLPSLPFRQPQFLPSQPQAQSQSYAELSSQLQQHQPSPSFSRGPSSMVSAPPSVSSIPTTVSTLPLPVAGSEDNSPLSSVSTPATSSPRVGPIPAASSAASSFPASSASLLPPTATVNAQSALLDSNFPPLVGSVPKPSILPSPISLNSSIRLETENGTTTVSQSAPTSPHSSGLQSAAITPAATPALPALSASPASSVNSAPVPASPLKQAASVAAPQAAFSASPLSTTSFGPRSHSPPPRFRRFPLPSASSSTPQQSSAYVRHHASVSSSSTMKPTEKESSNKIQSGRSSSTSSCSPLPSSFLLSHAPLGSAKRPFPSISPRSLSAASSASIISSSSVRRSSVSSSASSDFSPFANSLSATASTPSSSLLTSTAVKTNKTNRSTSAALSVDPLSISSSSSSLSSSVLSSSVSSAISSSESSFPSSKHSKHLSSASSSYGSSSSVRSSPKSSSIATVSSSLLSSSSYSSSFSSAMSSTSEINSSFSFSSSRGHKRQHVSSASSSSSSSCCVSSSSSILGSCSDASLSFSAANDTFSSSSSVSSSSSTSTTIASASSAPISHSPVTRRRGASNALLQSNSSVPYCPSTPSHSTTAAAVQPPREEGNDKNHSVQQFRDGSDKVPVLLQQSQKQSQSTDQSAFIGATQDDDNDEQTAMAEQTNLPSSIDKSNEDLTPASVDSLSATSPHPDLSIPVTQVSQHFFVSLLASIRYFLFSVLSWTFSLLLTIIIALLQVLARMHFRAFSVWQNNHYFVFCFVFIYLFPFLTSYGSQLYLPTWVPPFLWYAFLLQAFCRDGSFFFLTLFRVLLPLCILTQTLCSSYQILNDLNGSERMLVGSFVAGFRLHHYSRPDYLLVMSIIALLALFYGSAFLVQWSVFLLSILVSETREFSLIQGVENAPFRLPFGLDSRKSSSMVVGDSAESAPSLSNPSKDLRHRPLVPLERATFLPRNKFPRFFKNHCLS